MKQLLILSTLILAACAPQSKDGSSSNRSASFCSRDVERETRAIIDQNGWNPSAALVAGIVADAEADNSCSFQVFYPPCTNAIANEYQTSLNGIPRPMDQDLSDYYWHEIQDRYSCVMPSFIFQQN